LFLGSPALSEPVRRVVPVSRQKPPPWGITVTPRVLAAARELLVLAAGAGKADAVARALAQEGDVQRTPSRLAARPGATWLVDGAAAQAT
jgi:6-phosphogluconolactonase